MYYILLKDKLALNGILNKSCGFVLVVVEKYINIFAFVPLNTEVQWEADYI